MLGDGDCWLAQGVQLSLQRSPRLEAVGKHHENRAWWRRSFLDAHFSVREIGVAENERRRSEEMRVSKVVQMRVDVSNRDALDRAILFVEADDAHRATASVPQFTIERNDHFIQSQLTIVLQDFYCTIRCLPCFRSVTQSIHDTAKKHGLRLIIRGVVTTDALAGVRLTHNRYLTAQRSSPRFELSGEDASAFNQTVIELHFVGNPADSSKAGA